MDVVAFAGTSPNGTDPAVPTTTPFKPPQIPAAALAAFDVPLTAFTDLLVHGHQGDLMNDYLWRVSKFLVRYVWKPLELLGFNNPIRPAKNYSLQGLTQRRLHRYVVKEQKPLIVGHTHRPHLPQKGELPFYNTGSCVHPRCITALEYYKKRPWCSPR